MACVALGAWEGVNVLIVILTFFARHLQVSPDWFGEVGKLIGELFLAWFSVRTLSHGSLLSIKKASHNRYGIQSC